MIRRFLATLALGFSILIAPISVAAQPVQGKLVRIGVLGNEWWPPVFTISPTLLARADEVIE